MNKIDLLAYRMRVRKALCKQPTEFIKITKEECERLLKEKGK